MMSKLRIEICNERLVPRFGVDRFLVLLAGQLVQSGHEVSFSCLRCDRAMLAPISEDVDVIELPAGLDVMAAENAVLSVSQQKWKERSPNVVVTGGWPFFQAAVAAGRLGIKSVFIDAGAVAQDGLPGSVAPAQQELRRIRQLTLPFIDRVFPISDFIRVSQSEPDRGSELGLRTVLLGGDHMCLGTFHGDGRAQDPDLVPKLQARLNTGEMLLLCLGRFEPEGYKNSAAAYELLRLVQKEHPAIRLLILDAGSDCHIPSDLQCSVIALGTPDDHTLQEVMKLCRAGVSMSVWEGFNLPLAEMQWLDKPAFALNIGAHPEIVAHPWLLSDNIAEMAAKVSALLCGKGPSDLPQRFEVFRKRHPWTRTLSIWEKEIGELAAEPVNAAAELPGSLHRTKRTILIDVSNASRDPANPGVIRVTRRLSSVLKQHEELEIAFVAWNKNTGNYMFLEKKRQNILHTFGGPEDGPGLLATCRPDLKVEDFVRSIALAQSHPPVLFMPETMLDEYASCRIDWARSQHLKSAALLYDLIPVFHTELCDPVVSGIFPSYLEAITKADAVWSNSQFTLSELRRYVADKGGALPEILEAVILPGQFGEVARNESEYSGTADEIRILCVSTLEPRKNHLRLLRAFQSLRQSRPELPIRLVFVGNRYAAAPEIADQVQEASRQDPHIDWCGIADDARLANEYERAAFTVYPSLVEGFGLPILESLWMGRPCITHRSGVMEELAADGGCLTADMTNDKEIKLALERLATDWDLRLRLAQQAQNRKIATWHDYGADIASRLIAL